MGTLLHLPTRRSATIAVRQVVGRSRKSDLRIPNRRVSAEHAIVAWSGVSWVVRDLGSTNGTFVDGRRLGIGERVRLKRNALLAFGDPEDAWRLVSDSPPLPTVVDVVTGESLDQEGPILGIPSTEDPEITVYWSKSGWVVEADGKARPLLDNTYVRAGTREYEVQFPEELAGTLAGPEEVAEEREPLQHFRFIFRGHEHAGVGMDAEGRNGRLKLRPRAHHVTLLALAKERLHDIQKGMSADLAGWRDYDTTATRLGIDPKTLNVHIYRARQELARNGICGASAIVERRSESRELRFGGVAVTILDV